MTSYDQFIAKITEEKKDYTDTQWDENDKEFKQYTEECYEKYKDDLTDGERKKYWGSVMKYYYHRYGNDLFNELRNETGQLSEIFNDEFKDVLEKAVEGLKEYLDKDIKDDLKGILDDVLKGVEEIRNELKKELDKD